MFIMPESKWSKFCTYDAGCRSLHSNDFTQNERLSNTSSTTAGHLIESTRRLGGFKNSRKCKGDPPDVDETPSDAADRRGSEALRAELRVSALGRRHVTSHWLCAFQHCKGPPSVE